MRYFQAILLGLCSSFLVGCVNPDPVRNTANRPNELHRQASFVDNAVHLLVATIEQPGGDKVINEDVWKLADEQLKDLDKKTDLADNGFRIGVIGLSPPPSLRELIESPRSCASPRRLRVLEGTPTEIKIGPVQPVCSFHLEGPADQPEFNLDKAECLLNIEAHRLESGAIELQLTPMVRHGKPGLDRQPVLDPGGILRWNTAVHQKIETFKTLSWNQTLSDTDYLIIGCWVDRQDTLGQKMFLEDNPTRSIQRLLVIRTVPVADLSSEPEGNADRIAPIARQAGLTSTKKVPQYPN